MKTTLLTVIALAMMACAGQTVQAGAIIVDNFSEPTTYYRISAHQGETVTQTDTGLASVLGGTRIVSLTNNQGYYPGHALGYGPNYGLSMATDCSGWASFSVLYNANGSGLGIDLSGATDITANFYADHFGYGKRSVMSVTLYDMDGLSYTDSKIWNTVSRVNASIFVDHTFDLDDFSGIDKSRIAGLKFSYEGDWANDVVIRSLTIDTVPEPASVLLFGTSLFGAIPFIRRKRKA